MEVGDHNMSKKIKIEFLGGYGKCPLCEENSLEEVLSVDYAWAVGNCKKCDKTIPLKRVGSIYESEIFEDESKGQFDREYIKENFCPDCNYVQECRERVLDDYLCPPAKELIKMFKKNIGSYEIRSNLKIVDGGPYSGMKNNLGWQEVNPPTIIINGEEMPPIPLSKAVLKNLLQTEKGDSDD